MNDLESALTSTADYDAQGLMTPKPYDALLLASFGGPEGQEDVIPFLRNVTRGRGIPDERLEEVATHYRANGGVSPINEQNRALKAALEAELAAQGIDLPVYWGNRNWDPFIQPTLEQMYESGHRRVLMLSTSAYSGYSSCRQYREDAGVALKASGLEGKLEVDKVRQYFNTPGFIQPSVEGLKEGLASVREQLAQSGSPDGQIKIVFATHSIPNSDADAAGPRDKSYLEGTFPVEEWPAADLYSAQHLAVAQEILAQVPEAAGLEHSLVFQSRSGAPHIPWLEPDINDAFEEYKEQGVAGVVVMPIGFISDHMEVLWDLDTEAKQTAADLGLAFHRAPTAGTHPAFVQGLVGLVKERLGLSTGRAAATTCGAWFDVCRPECCVKVMRDGTTKPTIAAVDAEVKAPAL